MKLMERHNWFVGRNNLTISLLRFYVAIIFVTSEKSIIYKLDVYQDSKQQVSFVFHSLEDAVMFTEQEINECKTVDEIIEIYKEYYYQEENTKTRTRK